LHLDAAARLECVRRKPLFHLLGGDGPRNGETMKLKVFEPHERTGKAHHSIRHDANRCPPFFAQIT
jgi:hypothetical protein